MPYACLVLVGYILEHLWGMLNIGTKLRIQSINIEQIPAIGAGFMMGIEASCPII
jgi:hypothetical protein